MNHPSIHSKREQHGVVLIFALIMLVLISMLSISMVRSSTMDERMAGGARDRNKAFQAAEYALRTCLEPLQHSTYVNTDPVPLDPALPPALPVWEVASNWTSPISREIPVSYGAYPGLSGNPRCLYETLAIDTSYRITARAQGGSDTTAVILQATFSNE